MTKTPWLTFWPNLHTTACCLYHTSLRSEANGNVDVG